MVGPIVIQSSDATVPSSSHDVERFLLFNVFDETKSRYLKTNLINNVHSLAGPRSTKVALNAQNASEPLSDSLYRLTKNGLFRKYSKKHTVNGRAFCTLVGLTGSENSFTEGQRVRWHLLSIGDEIDFHSPSWEGHSVESMYSTVDAKGLHSPSATVPLMPATMHSVDMVMKPGKWGLANLASNHFKAGSRALFEVVSSSDKEFKPWAPASASQTDESKTARYYIAADEVEWDYAPIGRDKCSDQEFDEVSHIYTSKGPHRIGTKYIKAIYREYSSNGKFDELRWGDQSRFNPASEHLGILGPVIKAAVGETIEIVFRNNLRSDASLVAFGGSLTPSSVEALNDRQEKAVDGGERSSLSVVPGGEVRITIPVSHSAGPMKGSKQNSVSYLYGSDVDFVADTNSGLVGVFIIHSEDGGSRLSSPIGFHREFVTLLHTFDENLSRYAKMNTLKYAEDGDTVDFKDPSFRESNRMHSMNGYIHCNGPQASAKQFQSVRWYMLSLGTSYDLHGPSVSGYTFSTSADTAEHQVALLAPGMARTVDMTLDQAGTWLVRDAVVDNQRAGMEMFFDVAAVLHPGA